MKSLIEYLGCVKYYLRPSGLGDYRVEKFSALTKKIIPFFHKYPLQGVKSLYYKDFFLIADLMTNKVHLTVSGL